MVRRKDLKSDFWSVWSVVAELTVDVSSSESASYLR